MSQVLLINCQQKDDRHEIQTLPTKYYKLLMKKNRYKMITQNKICL